jgi:hypothetical protein
MSHLALLHYSLLVRLISNSWKWPIRLHCQHSFSQSVHFVWNGCTRLLCTILKSCGNYTFSSTLNPSCLEKSLKVSKCIWDAKEKHLLGCYSEFAYFTFLPIWKHCCEKHNNEPRALLLFYSRNTSNFCSCRSGLLVPNTSLIRWMNLGVITNFMACYLHCIFRQLAGETYREDIIH